jgi:hypothetical protein
VGLNPQTGETAPTSKSVLAVRLEFDGTVQALGVIRIGYGDQNDGEHTPRNLRECEAEAAALLCCSTLDWPGVEFSRGYIQSWWVRAIRFLIARHSVCSRPPIRS